MFLSLLDGDVRDVYRGLGGHRTAATQPPVHSESVCDGSPRQPATSRTLRHQVSAPVGLRIGYCDERLVYSKGDISATKGGAYVFDTSIKSPEVLKILCF